MTEYPSILLKTAKLLILFSILYFLWATAAYTMHIELSSIPFIGPLLARLQPLGWFPTFNQTYHTALQRMTIRINNSMSNGTQLYLQNINATIVVASNGTVYANVSSYTNDTDTMLIYFYNRVGWKYACIYSLFLNKTICNRTYSNFSQQYLEAINTSVGMTLTEQEAQPVTFAIPMNVNDHGGVLESYNYTYNPSDEYIYNILNTNPTQIYSIPSDYEITNAVIDFNETVTRCLKFEVPRFGRVRVNVTMPSPIIYYEIPKQFLNNSMFKGNYAYVDYNPYPCCGIKNPDMVRVRVCS